MTPADDAQLPDSRTAGIHRATGCAEGNEASDSDFHTRRLGETTAYEPRTVGKLRLLEQVGAGAFGSVWKARDAQLGRTVAVKLPHRNLISSAANRERFLREARAAAQLRHPGIVPLYEVEEIDGLPAIVSAFIEGVSLRELLDVRRLEPREAAVLIADVADALDYAHSMKLVHRDVKPGNLMVEFAPGQGVNTRLDQVALSSSASGASHGSDAGSTVIRSGPTSQLAGPRVLVLDFGLALREEAEATMTTEGQILGTPAYMSPEQAAGHGHRVDRRSDVVSLPAQSSVVGALRFSPDGNLLASAGFDHDVRIWDLASAKETRTLRGHDKEVVGLAWSHDGGRLASAGWDFTARLWDAGTGQGLATFRGHLDSLNAIDVSDDHQLLFTCAGDDMLRVWDTSVPPVVRTIDTQRPGSASAAWHPNGDRFVTCHGSRWTIWDARSGHAGESGAGFGPCWSRDGSRFAVAENLTVVVTSGDKRIWKQTFDQPHAPRCLAWHPDNRRLLVGHSNGITIWTIDSGEVAPIPCGEHFDVVTVACHPDGHSAVGASTSGRFVICDTQKRAVTRRIQVDVRELVRSIRWSPDATQMATAGDSHTVVIWDVAAWKPLRSFRGHTFDLHGCSWSADGRRIASASRDGSVQVWDVATGNSALTFRQGDEMYAAEWSPDGERLLTVGGDGIVKLYDATVSPTEPEPTR